MYAAEMMWNDDQFQTKIKSILTFILGKGFDGFVHILVPRRDTVLGEAALEAENNQLLHVRDDFFDIFGVHRDDWIVHPAVIRAKPI